MGPLDVRSVVLPLTTPVDLPKIPSARKDTVRCRDRRIAQGFASSPPAARKYLPYGDGSGSAGGEFLGPRGIENETTPGGKAVEGHRPLDARQGPQRWRMRRGRTEQSLGIGVPGALEEAVDVPCSTMCPAYMTYTSSRVSAPPQVVGDEDDGGAEAIFSPIMRSSTWAWMVTSSAVVSSSATRSLGCR